MTILFVLLFLAAASVLIAAYPQNYNCNGETWKGGATFGHMNVNKFTAAKTECVIEGVPASFAAGQTYQIRVVSKNLLAHKLVVAEGSLAADKVRHYTHKHDID